MMLKKNYSILKEERNTDRVLKGKWKLGYFRRKGTAVYKAAWLTFQTECFWQEARQCSSTSCSRPSRPPRRDACSWRRRCRCLRGTCTGVACGTRDPPGCTGWSPDCRRTATRGTRSLQHTNTRHYWETWWGSGTARKDLTWVSLAEHVTHPCGCTGWSPHWHTRKEIYYYDKGTYKGFVCDPTVQLCLMWIPPYCHCSTASGMRCLK